MTGVKPGGILVGVVLAIFAFVGFESAGSLGVESRNSFRNVPRAILWSCLIVGLFYVVVSYSQIYGFQNVKGGILASTAAPGTHRTSRSPSPRYPWSRSRS